MAFTRVKAIAVNEPVVFVKIAAVANVTSVPRNSTSYNCNYKLDQSSEVAYFEAPEDTEFTTSDYVVLNSQGSNGFMKGAQFDSTYVALIDDAFSGITSLTVSTGGATSNTLAAATNTDSLTDSSGGSADTTIAAITNAANAGSADVAPVANGFADIAAQLAKQRTLNTVLINAITSLGAKVNEVLAAD